MRDCTGWHISVNSKEWVISRYDLRPISYLNFRTSIAEDRHDHSLDIKASLPQHMYWNWSNTKDIGMSPTEIILWISPYFMLPSPQSLPWFLQPEAVSPSLKTTSVLYIYPLHVIWLCVCVYPHLLNYK